MKCEIKHLDRRYDDQDNLYYCERKAEAKSPEQKDWWRLYAFCVVKHYDSVGDLDSTELYVNPQPVRDLLRDVIGDYPGDPIDASDVRIASPYPSLFHYRKQIEAEGARRFADDPESRAQLDMLLDWIRARFEDEIAAYERCLYSDLKPISYDKLWILFPPGTMAYMKVNNEDRVFRVSSSWYGDDEDDGESRLNFSLTFIDYDGDRLGTRYSTGAIHKYAGSRPLSELAIMPLDLVNGADEKRERLLARGRKFESLVGQHFMQYEGVAYKQTSDGMARYSVSGRVMVDCKTYHRLRPNMAFVVIDLTKHTDEEDRRLSDEEALTANPRVRGYSFSEKEFLEFSVDLLKPIRWNSNCFDDLVLDAGVKKTMQALVSVRSQERESFDDIVEGKGQGLVCVLHGPPGVGKTLTAECVAEYVRRPLYMVSSGDRKFSRPWRCQSPLPGNRITQLTSSSLVGTSSMDLDFRLTQIMDMAATWRAVLLIDEADVFLERRSLNDLHRNAMVSVFLRVLEYYSGILFLTTNRVTTFDDAFKSRIHIPIRYTDLSRAGRVEIWRNMLRRVPGGVEIDEKGIEALAEHELNGRQIKNVIKAAESLAAFEGARIDLERMQEVTRIQATFERDLDSVIGIDYTAPGSSKKNAEERNMFL